MTTTARPDSRASATTSTAGVTPTPPAPTRAADSRGRRPRHLGEEERARLDAQDPAEGAAPLREEAHAHLGRRPVGIDFDNIKYFVRSTEKQAASWDDLPEGHPQHLRPTGHPRGGEAAPRRRRRRPVRVRGRLPPDPRGPRGAGRHLPRHRHRPARAPRAVQGVLRAPSSPRRQQVRGAEYRRVVRWIIHLRPKGVNVEIPLQAYFRINTENMGQFERTLIIVDEGAYVHYVEGCTAPIYSSDSLHSAVVEIVVKKAHAAGTRRSRTGRTTSTTLSPSARCAEGATMEWIDGNIGSKVTMKYPAVFLMGEHARARRCRSRSRARVSTRTPARRWCTPPRTRPSIISKSVARGGGRTCYRGLSRFSRARTTRRPTWFATRCSSTTISRSDTYPYIDVREDDVQMGHEATRLEDQRRQFSTS